jgi:hypothetical protein
VLHTHMHFALKMKVNWAVAMLPLGKSFQEPVVPTPSRM